MVISLLFCGSLSGAIQELNTASAEAKKDDKCQTAVGTQIKAARMHLELLQEVKDEVGAVSMAGAIGELDVPACPAPVRKAITAAVAQLTGKAPPEDNDKEQDADPVKAKPTAHPAQKAEISELETQSIAVGKQLGAKWKVLNVAETREKRGEWVQTLDAEKCYAFIGVAAANAKKLAIYLFDPAGKKRAYRKGRDPTAMMYLCPFVSGDYVMQGKVKQRSDQGFLIATYVRE